MKGLKTAEKWWFLARKIGDFEIIGQTPDRLCANGPAAISPVRCRFFFR
jgi:hypothetical protein